MLIIFLLSLLAWTITFFPIKYWSLVGIDATSSGYHRWVLTLLWTSFSYLIVFGGAEKWRQLESFSHLRQLADDERIVLQAFIRENRLTCQFQAWASGVSGLVEDKILVIDRHIDQNARNGGVLVCRIKPFAFRYLKKHTILIDPE